MEKNDVLNSLRKAETKEGNDAKPKTDGESGVAADVGRPKE